MEQKKNTILFPYKWIHCCWIRIHFERMNVRVMTQEIRTKSTPFFSFSMNRTDYKEKKERVLHKIYVSKGISRRHSLQSCFQRWCFLFFRSMAVGSQCTVAIMSWMLYSTQLHLSGVMAKYINSFATTKKNDYIFSFIRILFMFHC